MGTGINLREHFDAATYRPAGWREDFFTNQFHNRLRYGFAPAQGAAKKGTVVLTHGYGEFIELYYQAIQEYQKMGFDVWAMDFYGFGKSGRDDPENPHRPSTKGMLRHVRDLDYFVRHVVQKVPDRPLVMSTNSMGGHIGLLYLEKHPGVFDAAVMSSPMFDIYRLGLPVIARPVIRAIFNIASALGLKNTVVPASPALWAKIGGVGAAIARSPRTGLREAFNDMMRIALPETRVDRPTFGWIAKAFNTIVKSTRPEALRKVTIPILLGSSGMETLVDNATIDRAAQIMPKATLIKLPTAQHGLWFEDDGNYDRWAGAVRGFMHKITGDPRGNNDPAAPQHGAGPDAGRDPGARARIRAAFPVPAAPAYAPHASA